MMQLCRFMSKMELDKYLAGDTLENHTNWKKEHNRSVSKGFCFFPLTEKDTPGKLIHILTGIARTECVLIVSDPEGCLHRSYGIYRDIKHDDGFTFPVPVIKKTEYCTEKYSRFTMPMARYAEIRRFLSDWIFQWDNGEKTIGDDLLLPGEQPSLPPEYIDTETLLMLLKNFGGA